MWDANRPEFRDIMWRFDPLNLESFRDEIDEEYDDLGERFHKDVESGMPVDAFIAKWPQLVALEFHSLRLPSDDPMILTMTHELRDVHSAMVALLQRRGGSKYGSDNG